MKIRKIITGTLLTGALFTATAIPANAGISEDGTLPPQLEARIRVVCARVPNLLEKTENLMERLPAGPETKGSIAWVEAKAETARQKGRTELADALDNRANVLTQKLATLPTQKTNLDKLSAKCDTWGY